MFERLLQWTSRNGARVLFGVAIILFVSQMANVIVMYVSASSGGDMYGHGAPGGLAWTFLLTAFTTAFQSASMPLIGALVIDRLKPRE
jgi:hypothetical protein